MTAFLNKWCCLGAAVLVALAGVFELIDQTTMIILVIVLTVCMPNARGACRAARRT